LHADILIATAGDLIANNEKEPLSNVSRKQRSLSSTVIYLYSIANAQILGHSSTTYCSSTLRDKLFLAF